MQRLFGWGDDAKVNDTKITIKALPASWYTSQDMFDLERRAIFSRRWLLISHKIRLPNVGDYFQTAAAGYPILVVKDRQGKIRAHHNVCRHRAYPLVEEAGGNVSILACKYHNWSYGLDGRLAKAPKYQVLDGFNKAANSLFSVHVHIDRLGFIWINLDANSPPKIAWQDDFAGSDGQPRLQSFDPTAFHFDHQHDITGDFNWKTIADNYSECYHCPTGHPALVPTADFSTYYVTTKGGVIEHWNTDDEEKGQALHIRTTFCYPGGHFTISPAFFYIGRWIPVSVGQTRLEYEVYKANDPALNSDFTRLDEIFKVVLREDKDLCNAAYRNIQMGIFSAGELHPQAEKGPRYFQQLTRELVMQHHKKEQTAKKRIWPAVPAHVQGKQSQEDIMFCEGLCSGDPSLSW